MWMGNTFARGYWKVYLNAYWLQQNKSTSYFFQATHGWLRAPSVQWRWIHANHNESHKYEDHPWRVHLQRSGTGLPFRLKPQLCHSECREFSWKKHLIDRILQLFGYLETPWILQKLSIAKTDSGAFKQQLSCIKVSDEFIHTHSINNIQNNHIMIPT